MPIKLLSDELVGCKLGATIFSADGRPLLRAGTVLTERYIRALKERGYVSVYVEDPLAPDVVAGDAISVETRIRAMSVLHKTLQQVTRGDPVAVVEAKDVVDKIIEDIELGPYVISGLNAIRCHDDYTFVHSINVCVLSLLTGKSLAYSRDRLRQLGIGALFHDIGKLRVPLDLLNKPGKLSEDEFQKIRMHAEDGYHILCSRLNPDFLSAAVALQHHERADGTGYPRGLSGQDIHEFSMITAVADVFDAVTSDRVYRSRVPPHEAAELLMLESRQCRLDARLVQKLLERVSIYPDGTIVRLSTGEIGVVVKQDEHDSSKPWLRILSDAECRPIEPVEVSLKALAEKGVKVSEVLNDYPPVLRRRD